MAKKYSYTEQEPKTVHDDTMAYPQGVTIPISLPSTGDYSVEDLRKELTDFAMRLLHRSTSVQSSSHVSWRQLTLSDKVKAMSLGESSLSIDPRSDKELLVEALEEKYR